jgi:hypothetical protein
MVDRRASLISRGSIALTIPIAVAMTVSSAAGAFGRAYVRETPSWAAQGTGQDFANLFVVLPFLLVVAVFAWRGSVRAVLLWLGALLYVLYSYVLYAFCVHFNEWFLAYVATLGLTFYTLIGAVASVDLRQASEASRGAAHTRALSVLLTVVGVGFAVLWLSDVIPAIAHGRAPASADEVGLPVNPVHVLDLAFALPGVIFTGVLLWKRHVYGLLFAVPCATFLILMGIAILAMARAMSLRGVPGAGGFPVPIAITIATTIYTTAAYLRDIRRQ